MFRGTSIVRRGEKISAFSWVKCQAKDAASGDCLFVILFRNHPGVWDYQKRCGVYVRPRD